MTPTLITANALILAGRNGNFAIGPSPGLKDLWIKLMEDFGHITGQVDMKAYGVCHNFDGAGRMDYMAAVQVVNAGQVPGYLHTLIIPKRNVAVFHHDGGLDGLSTTWGKIFSVGLPTAKLDVAPGPQFEVYSENFDADAGTGSIDIHIPVL
jgi:AraC family transcriptional regulator